MRKTSTNSQLKPKKRKSLVVFSSNPSSQPAIEQLKEIAQVTNASSIIERSPKTPAEIQNAIATLQNGNFDAAVIFTHPKESPFSLAYLCYLAGISIRIGQSQEFGGQVLSHCLEPPKAERDRHKPLIQTLTQALE